jgi:LPPG:FO 2-phospho-L-lactate transferase
MVDMLKVYGETVWFNLGDRDLATHLLRTQALHNGQTLTQITQTLTRALGVKQNILPATDDPLATIIETDANSQLSFQEYFVKYRWQPRAVTIHYRGSASARATPAVLSAIEQADMLVICPSNPVLSIAPILQVQGLRAALENRHVPCVALSPLIGGKAVKGPADKIMRELGLENTQRGIAQFYDKLIDGLVIDTVDAHEVNALQAEFPNLSILITQTLMISMEDRVRLATEVLNWSTYSRKANL